eukprot:GSChrysophyteH1.ASY1.ANO1.2475.1 assembled CDS
MDSIFICSPRHFLTSSLTAELALHDFCESKIVPVPVPESPGDYKLISDVLTSPAQSSQGTSSFGNSSHNGTSGSRSSRIPSSREWFGSAAGNLRSQDLHFMSSNPSSPLHLSKTIGVGIADAKSKGSSSGSVGDGSSIAFGEGLFGSSHSPGSKGGRSINPFSPDTNLATILSPSVDLLSSQGMSHDLESMGRIDKNDRRKNMNMGNAFGGYVDFDHILTASSSKTYTSILNSPPTTLDENSNSSSGSLDRVGSKRRKGANYSSNGSSKRSTARLKSVSPPGSNGSPSAAESRNKNRKNKTASPIHASSQDGAFSALSDAKKPNQVSPDRSDQQRKIRCNCRRTKCIKLYCDCFHALKYCEGCNCVDCSNIQEKEAERKAAINSTLERDPEAFAPRIKDDPTGNSKSHLSGCHCKRSACLKKYCECFSYGIPCSEKCRCLDCQNKPNKGVGASTEVSPVGFPVSDGDILDVDHVQTKSPLGSEVHLKTHSQLLEDDMLGILGSN